MNHPRVTPLLSPGFFLGWNEYEFQVNRISAVQMSLVQAITYTVIIWVCVTHSVSHLNPIVTLSFFFS